MITLYGHPRTRTYRCLWMLHELDIEFTHVPTHYQDGGTRAPEFLAINPNGHVPALVDGDLRLFESMAINLYLARKYDKGFWPESLEAQALATQWSFWVMTEVEPGLLQYLNHVAALPEAERDPERARSASESLATPLTVLDAQLAKGPHVLGAEISVADINLASVLSWARIGRMDLTGVPHVKAWLEGCLARPAAKAARG